eukprot:364939-Chlamydomonas_euryale.AAC.11
MLTAVRADMRAHDTVVLANTRGEGLAAAASDGQEMLYYLTIEGGGTKEDVARSATLYKANRQGDAIRSQPLDTSKAQLNISNFSGPDFKYTADMRVSGGWVAVMLARQLHRGEDGLQHQSGCALVFSADTLRLVRNHGQTSGHSLDNVLTVARDGSFVGIDLGDNYPRGVHLHKFGGEGPMKAQRLVYTFKTEHGKTPNNPAGRTFDRYDEISSNATTFYKWSNDNNTVRGGLHHRLCRTAPGGLSLLNERDLGFHGQALRDPRNIGLVQVRTDFGGTGDVVLSKGVAETGGFYTFNGEWSSQQHSGIVWLTDYTDKGQENASRVKTAQLADGRVLLIWEKWTEHQYVNTYAMTVTSAGRKLGEAAELGPGVRLGRRDDPLVAGGKVYLFAGDKASSALVVTVLQP